MDIFREALDAGFSCNEARRYATIEIDDRIAKGLLKGPRQCVLMVIQGKPQVVQLSAPALPSGYSEPDVEVPPLPVNPPHAPQIVSRRPLRLKPRVAPAPPRFPFIKVKV